MRQRVPFDSTRLRLRKSTGPTVLVVVGKTRAFPKVTFCPKAVCLSNLPLQFSAEAQTAIAARRLGDPPVCIRAAGRPSKGGQPTQLTEEPGPELGLGPGS